MLILKKKISTQQKKNAVLKYMIRQDISHIMHSETACFKILPGALVTQLYLCGPRREKTCLRRVANNKVADQPAHLRSLISAFVIRFLESITSRLATREISSF